MLKSKSRSKISLFIALIAIFSISCGREYIKTIKVKRNFSGALEEVKKKI